MKSLRTLQQTVVGSAGCLSALLWIAGVSTGCIQDDFGAGLICQGGGCGEQDCTNGDCASKSEGNSGGEGDKTSSASQSSSLDSQQESESGVASDSSENDSTAEESSDELESGEDSDANLCENKNKDPGESDVDCGGNCSPCEDGKACTQPADCVSEACEDSICGTQAMSCKVDADCQEASNPCVHRTCESGRCKSEMLDDMECDDQDSCTTNDRCLAGNCRGDDARLIAETFAGGQGQWQFQRSDSRRVSFLTDKSIWEIGPAIKSDCDHDEPGQISGEDPAQDHSDDAQDLNNKVAGTRIGGCVLPEEGRAVDCLESPAFALTGPGLELSLWRHLHTGGYDSIADLGWRHWYRLRKEDGTAVLIAPLPADQQIDDLNWVQEVFPLPAEAKEGNWRLGICSENRDRGSASFASKMAGWSVDDIVIGPVGCRKTGSLP